MASDLINLNLCCISKACMHPACIILYWIVKSNRITVWRNISTLCLLLSEKKNVHVFLCLLFLVFALPFSPSRLSVLSSLSLCVCYFSPVIRHTDLSLSPSKTTKINFPALSHVEGQQSGATPVHAFHSPTHSPKHPHGHNMTHTQVQTHWPAIHHITVF